jgi:MFS family permease
MKSSTGQTDLESDHSSPNCGGQSDHPSSAGGPRPEPGAGDAIISSGRTMKINWYSEFTNVERRTFWACLGGYTLDAMDSTMYALLAPVFITVLGFTKPEIGALTTVGLIGNCFGGWIAGAVADRFGRMSLLKVTVLWVSAFSLLAALSSNYDEFMVVRFLQGLGFGGEAAVGGVLISEVVRSHLRGRAVSSVQVGYGLGYALSTALMPIIFYFSPEAVGWRIMFAAGVIPALLVVYIRRFVPESDSYQKIAAARRSGAKAAPFWTIFATSNLRGTLLGLLLATGILGGGFSIHAWLPTYLRLTLHLKVASTSGYLAMSIAGLLIGPIVSGFISDRIGRRATFVAFLICEAVVVIAFLFMPLNLNAAFGLLFLQGSLQGGAAACMLPTFAELFSTDIRASGSGFCITGGRGIGSISTSVIGVLGTVIPLGHAMGICSLTAFSLAILAAMFLPERSGVDLNAVDGKGAVS